MQSWKKENQKPEEAVEMSSYASDIDYMCYN